MSEAWLFLGHLLRLHNNTKVSESLARTIEVGVLLGVVLRILVHATHLNYEEVANEWHPWQIAAAGHCQLSWKRDATSCGRRILMISYCGNGIKGQGSISQLQLSCWANEGITLHAHFTSRHVNTKVVAKSLSFSENAEFAKLHWRVHFGIFQQMSRTGNLVLVSGVLSEDFTLEDVHGSVPQFPSYQLYADKIPATR